MDKMLITNQAGERLEVGVVRFFEYNETAFLIYTLSEVDANNYVKLYVTKVNVDNVKFGSGRNSARIEQLGLVDENKRISICVRIVLMWCYLDQ